MFFQTQNDKLGGIFDYLYRKYSTKCKELVITDQSSVHFGYGAADVIVKPNEGVGIKDNFATYSVENSYFIIDLQVHRIKLTSYTIQTRTDVGNGLFFPISWIIEATNDSKTWTQISNVAASGFDSYNQYKTFTVSNANVYKSFKFTMQGKDYGNYYYLVLHRIEFFGFLYSIIPLDTKCAKQTCNSLKYIIFLLTLALS